MQHLHLIAEFVQRTVKVLEFYACVHGCVCFPRVCADAVQRQTMALLKIVRGLSMCIARFSGRRSSGSHTVDYFSDRLFLQ